MQIVVGMIVSRWMDGWIDDSYLDSHGVLIVPFDSSSPPVFISMKQFINLDNLLCSIHRR